MSRWQRRVDDLLYDGETVLESVDVGSARVVVTSHRVLTFTPDLDGENFQQADRPNVVGVSTGAHSMEDWLRRGLMVGVVGVAFLFAGLLFDPESVFGDDIELDTGTASDFGLGSLMEVTQSMFALLLNLDTLLLNVGALALLVSTVVLGVYWHFRTPTLVIELAGEEADLHVPRPDDAKSVGARLERAILPEPPDRDLDGDSNNHDRSNPHDGTDQEHAGGATSEDGGGFVDDTATEEDTT